MSVLIIPQATAFTCMLLGASSFARAFVNALIPPFVAEYATSVEAPTQPQTDDIFIILPSWLPSIIGMASLQQLKTDVRFEVIILFQSEGVMSCKRPIYEIPALFINISALPKRSFIREKNSAAFSKMPIFPTYVIQSAPMFSISSFNESSISAFL